MIVLLLRHKQFGVCFSVLQVLYDHLLIVVLGEKMVFTCNVYRAKAVYQSIRPTQFTEKINQQSF